ncbi:hypothetical protein [Nocardia nova]|nr:hypothetical protein [Nocardia nova]
MLEDVLEGLASRQQAEQVYRVAFIDDPAGGPLTVDAAETRRIRAAG